ncbi:uncharacterized protein LOC111103131 isoform X3 [Crassostrea virginica]
MDKTYGFPVFPVTSCPATAVDWEQAAKQRNCSLTGVRDTYLCLPNQEKTTLLEFCYDKVRPMVQEDSSCLNINTQDGCYHEDPSCPNKTFNGLERDLTYHTTGEYWIAGLVIGILVLIAVFALIISRRRIYRFLRSRKGERRHHEAFQLATTTCSIQSTRAIKKRSQWDSIEDAQPNVSNPAPPPPPPPPSNT